MAIYNKLFNYLNILNINVLYQGPDFDDMSSFFPCKIDDAIQYILILYMERAGSKNNYFIVHIFVILC